ncbi:MAG: hypothetical protein ACRD0U_01545 [Acidimicrobiales bacterium]
MLTRRRCRPWILLGVVAAALVAGAGGCGLESGSDSCTDVTLEAEPVTVNDPFEPLALTARMTANGKPLAGAELNFFIEPETPSGEKGVGGGTGRATTDAEGVARFVREGGIDGLVFGEDRLTEYVVQFSSPSRIGGTQYCQAETTGPVTDATTAPVPTVGG